MSEILPIAFAVYPLLLSGITLVWLFKLRDRTHPGWTVWVLACGSIIVFAFLTSPWAFTSYYLRYVILVLFAVTTALSYFGTRHSGPHSSAHGSGITVPSILVFLLFAAFDTLAISSYYPSGKTLDVTLPFRSGTYYVLQGGSSAITNPFHSLGGSRQAMDIVKLNGFGNRADGIAPRTLSAYRIFGEKLYSPCQGSIIRVRDGLPDNSPGNPDTEHPEGNYIALKCARGDILMAHLRHGSIKVAQGDTVSMGQPLAEIGNSGNTLEPHLHIEASTDDRKTLLTINGQSLSINSLIKGQVRSDSIDQTLH